jgi:1,2-phenylacetyl-CoA epoxidase PaaB subunit
MKLYRVSLKEQDGDKFTVMFDCMAYDADHAEEIASNMYVGQSIINITLL